MIPDPDDDPRPPPRPMPCPRMGGSWWRLEERVWRRADGRTWPLRPPAALRKELAAFDALTPPRGSPWPGVPVRLGVVRRVLREGALGPLRTVASVGSLLRRAATYERDARVRPTAGAQAVWCREQAARHREQARRMAVQVWWAGTWWGRGAVPAFREGE